MSQLLNVNSRRAYAARLSFSIGKRGYNTLVLSCISFLIISFLFFIKGSSNVAFILLSPTTLCLVVALWWKMYLIKLPPEGTTLEQRLSVFAIAKISKLNSFSSAEIFNAIKSDWQAIFILHHLLLTSDLVDSAMESSTAGSEQIFNLAMQIADNNQSSSIEVGHICAALLYYSPDVVKMLIAQKSDSEDIINVANWLARKLVEEKSRDNIKFGGIGRDWSFGYTPLLNKLGFNISSSIQKHGANFSWLSDSDSVKSLEAALQRNAKAIALTGKVGIGKTTSVFAFAQKLIEGKTNKILAYHQVITINATDILSNVHAQNDLERIMINLSNEATHAGHIILFLDDAELFFSASPGSFDASQILQSIIQASFAPLILSFTPSEYEKVKAKNQTLANMLTQISVKEMNQADVMKVLEDQAIGLESNYKVLITYDALKSTYTLSGRYDEDTAYPGKATKLLNQAVELAENSLVSTKTIERTLEKSKGLLISSASPIEANQLLNLENIIHARMINQSDAVKAVSSSLRRSRAGVTNPNRPIGSFLFLGPTGVGKTELAKSLAATYFKAESNIIRLDMSEYQNSDDVKRILSSAKEDSNNLLMSVRNQPFSVVLLDEIEKAHSNILNLLLQLIDEGRLTDTDGRTVSFKDCIIIVTSNAGAETIKERIEKGEELTKFKDQLIDEVIKSKIFKPELINRFDDIVLFRPLNEHELAEVVKLMLVETNKTLSKQNIKVNLTDNAISKIVKIGYDPSFGARPMRRTLQKTVEDTVAEKILKGEAKAGDTISLNDSDLVI